MSIGKIKSYNGREFKQILLRNGFDLVWKKGDHWVFKRGENETISLPETPKMPMIRRLVKEYNLGLNV